MTEELGQTESPKRSVCSLSGCDDTLGQVEGEIKAYRD
jgi:hypothetical protein